MPHVWTVERPGGAAEWQPHSDRQPLSHRPESLYGLDGDAPRSGDDWKEIHNKLYRSLPQLRAHFFQRLVRGHPVSEAEAAGEIAFLQLAVPADGVYCVLSVCIDDWMTVAETLRRQDLELLSFSLLNIAQELIDDEQGGYVFECGAGEFAAALLMRDEDVARWLHAFVHRLRDHLTRYVARWAGISLTFGVGMRVRGIHRLAQSYARAREAVGGKVYLGKNKVIMPDEIRRGKQVNLEGVYTQLGELPRLLTAADEARLRDWLGRIFAELRQGSRLGDKCGQFVVLEAMLYTTQVLVDRRLHPSDRGIWGQGDIGTIFRLETLHDMQLLLADYLRKACALLNDQRSPKANGTIEKVKRIIESRYQESLTVRDIAGEVYLTSTYVCLLFKQLTGETLNDYVTRVRMEKAKELLERGDAKMCDVSAAVGYSEPSYFSKRFKKYTGLSPSEYRARHHEDSRIV